MSITKLGGFILSTSDGHIFPNSLKDDVLFFSKNTRILCGISNTGDAQFMISSAGVFANNMNINTLFASRLSNANNISFNIGNSTDLVKISSSNIQMKIDNKINLDISDVGVYASNIILNQNGNVNIFSDGGSNDLNIACMSNMRFLVNDIPVVQVNSNGFIFSSNTNFDTITVENTVIIGQDPNLGNYPLYISNTNMENISFFAEGTIVAYSSRYFSDRRIKKDIEDVDGGIALNRIMRLKPREYKYIDELKNPSNGHSKIGFIAQEIKEIIPEAVSECRKCLPNIMKSGLIIGVINDSTIKIKIRDLTESFTNKKLQVTYQNKSHVCLCLNAENPEYITIKFGGATRVKLMDFIYIHGSEVDDFKIIDFEPIISYLVSSVQSLQKELSRCLRES